MTRSVLGRVAPVALGLALVLPAAASAQVNGPIYPPPGGVSWTGNGNPIAVGGATWQYTGLDATSYDELYWGFYQVANPTSRYWGGTGNMSYLGFDETTGIATYQNTSVLHIYDAQYHYYHNYPTQLQVQFQPYGSSFGPLASGWLSPVSSGDVGIAGSFPVLDIAGQGLTQYQVWFQFNTAVTEVPLQTVWNSINTSPTDQLVTSQNGGFYYTDPQAVPEPASVVLLATGLLAVLGVAWRRGRGDGLLAE